MKKCLWLLPALLSFASLVAGAILWQQLPEQIPFFWPGDGFQSLSRGFFVFGLPFCALALHICFVWVCELAPWMLDASELRHFFCWWIIPTLQLLNCARSYSRALDNGLLPFVLAAIVLTVAIILWLILIRRLS